MKMKVPVKSLENTGHTRYKVPVTTKRKLHGIVAKEAYKKVWL